MRSALENLARDFHVGLTRVIARGLTSAAGVFRNAARFRRIGLVPARPPIAGPFPDIADHVVEAVTVRRECFHRSRALEPVVAAMFVREHALPRVRHALAPRRKFISPGEFSTVQAATGRKLPFRFGWQLLPDPIGVSFRIPVGDMNNRMIIEPADRGGGAVWTPPVGAEFEPPPLRPVSRVDRMMGRGKYKR